jgi:hypothetical protein
MPTTENEKFCKSCRTAKPMSGFYRHGAYRYATCKECVRLKTKHRRENPDLADKHRKQSFSANVKSRYGITVDRYNEIMGRGKLNGCAICGSKDPVRFHLDHCHVSGKIRGVLCQGCNIGLGGFKDNPASIELAASYLRPFEPGVSEALLCP